MTPPGQFLDLPQGRLHYHWMGDSDRIIVLVHGLTTPGFVWHKLAPLLVDQGYRVLIFDHFGRGHSDYPRATYGYDFYVKTLEDLLDALGIATPVCLLGYSMGGGIVAEYAARRPERVARLTALAPIGFGAHLGRVFGFIARAGRLGDWINHIVGGALWRMTIRRSADDLDLDEDTLAHFIEMTRDPGYTHAVLSSIRHVIQKDLSLTWATLKCPAQAIFAADDPLIPLSGAQRVQQVNPTAHVDIIPDSAHEVAFTHAREVAQKVIGFHTGA